MEKLNYYHREPRPSYRPGLLDRRWQDPLVAAVAVAWALLVLVGLIARFADGDLPSDSRGKSERAAGELYRAAKAQRQMFDVMLLAGGAACCAIAAGLVHRVRSGLRGWTAGSAALVTTCAIVGLLGLLWSAAQLSRAL